MTKHDFTNIETVKEVLKAARHTTGEIDRIIKSGDYRISNVNDFIDGEKWYWEKERWLKDNGDDEEFYNEELESYFDGFEVASWDELEKKLNAGEGVYNGGHYTVVEYDGELVMIEEQF